MLCGLRGQQCFHTDGFLFLFFSLLPSLQMHKKLKTTAVKEKENHQLKEHNIWAE